MPEQVGGDGDVALLGEAVGDVGDVVGQPPDLLDDDDAPAHVSRRVGAVGGQLVLGQLDHRSHPPVLPAKSEARRVDGSAGAMKRRSARFGDTPARPAWAPDTGTVRVMVTGGTGFVGSHVVVGLLASGHEVRLLVRRPELVADDLRTARQVPGHRTWHLGRRPRGGRRARRGSRQAGPRRCDAVVHAAAVFTTDPRRAAEVTATNVAATEAVLGLGAAAGCDPVIHISSTVALTRHGPSGPDLPLGDIDMPYSAVEDRVRASRPPVAGDRGAGRHGLPRGRLRAARPPLRRPGRPPCRTSSGAACRCGRPAATRASTCATWRRRSSRC